MNRWLAQLNKNDNSVNCYPQNSQKGSRSVLSGALGVVNQYETENNNTVWLEKLKKQKGVVATAIPAIPAISDKSNVVNIARARLIKASQGLDVDINELMDWYENDYKEIAKISGKTLRAYVMDYTKQIGNQT